MRLIKGTWNTAVLKLRKEVADLKQEVKHLELMLGYSNQADRYRDDLANYIKEVYAWQEDIIGKLRSEIVELKT
ncbi:hypothetical protein LCGC14_1948090 [marine sediment metagenome]|uniref:Uncharacterized protein n=1 Tax=marine sediment metagenome TaxID=412755 RepID=A0A0F9IFB0_9ZZZZ